MYDVVVGVVWCGVVLCVVVGYVVLFEVVCGCCMV